jgi:hypothetical protein
MGSRLAPPLDRIFRRKKLDTDLDLRKIANALIDLRQELLTREASSDKLRLKCRIVRAGSSNHKP